MSGGVSASVSPTARIISIARVERAFQHISQDIRQSYTIGYERVAGGRLGFHRVHVEVRSPDGRKLLTRTREGYHASS